MQKADIFNLETSIDSLPRVGLRGVRDFAKLGISTAKDLLFHFPFRHEDFSRVVPAANLKIGEKASVKVQVLLIANKRTPQKRRLITEAIFRDKSGSLKAIWFNQPYIPRLLRRGNWVYLSGTLEESYFGLHMINPIFERADSDKETVHAGRLIPIYHTRGSLTPRTIRSLVAKILHLAKSLPDWLPTELIERHNFPKLEEAIREMHFPKTFSTLTRARQRLAYNELFQAGLTALQARRQLDQTPAPAIPFQEESTKAFVETLPFTLTDDQRKAAWQILQDMERPRPMNRLLEGEVGSGKTVVAGIAILNAALSEFQTAYLAPTEILATQHAKTLAEILKGFPISIALLTGSTYVLNGQSEKRGVVEEAVREGKVNLIIGTHALIQKKTKFKKVGLVIVDEQHRFGVEQRGKLRGKGAAKDEVPHLLSMTATPIPRTLALTVYGDLDCSLLRELPKGRKPIITKLIKPKDRERAYEHIHQEIKKGHQGFVICPIIIESDKLGVKAATQEHEELSKKIFPNLKVGLLHGKMKADEKNRIMTEFRDAEIDLLVATAVVEVGIDVPNATVMIIEAAERFGLAQLHQFRGRIGRGQAPATCFLFTDNETAETVARLDFFTHHQDGFALAEEDLKLRGPGEFVGTAQSGFPKFRVASFHDRKLVELARREAEEFYEDFSKFSTPEDISLD